MWAFCEDRGNTARMLACESEQSRGGFLSSKIWRLQHRGFAALVKTGEAVSVRGIDKGGMFIPFTCDAGALNRVS